MNEHSIQCAICHYLHVALKGLPATYFAVPNGASRSKKKVRGRTISIEGQRLKAEGVRAGVADLIVFYDGRAIALEVKTVKGKQEPSQLAWEKTCVDAGVPYYVVRSIDDVCAALIGEGVPVRAKPSAQPGVMYDDTES